MQIFRFNSCKNICHINCSVVGNQNLNFFYSMSSSAPAALDAESKLTPRGSWSETETLPMDQFLITLCERVKKYQDDNATVEVCL